MSTMCGNTGKCMPQRACGSQRTAFGSPSGIQGLESGQACEAMLLPTEPSSSSILLYRHGFSLNLELTISARLASLWAQGCPYPHSPSAGVLTWVLGIWLTSCSHSKHCSNWAISPSPSFIFFFVFVFLLGHKTYKANNNKTLYNGNFIMQKCFYNIC